MDILSQGITEEIYQNLYMGSEREMMWHCNADPRFSYHTYIPENYREYKEKKLKLISFVHGTGRTIEWYRSLFKDFADKNGFAMIFPMFPGGLMDKNDFNSYKLLGYHGVRYDNIFLAMIDELAERFPIDIDKIYLYGWSGGGQFVHRFLYAHPERLAAVVIGAPGRPTYIDPGEDYYWGIRNFQEIFDKPFDIEKIRKVPVKIVVGEEDTLYVGESKWGTSRMERLINLRKNYEKNGLNVSMDIIPGIGHKGHDDIKSKYVLDFFLDVLSNASGK